MRPPSRLLLSALLASSLLLPACLSAPSGSEPPGGPGAPGPLDAGAVALEAGDYADEGPYAPCRGDMSASSVPCGTLPRFQLEGCNQASLATLQAEGVWTLHQRFPATEEGAQARFAVTNLSLRPDGGVQYLERGEPVLEAQLGPDAFFVSTAWPYRDAGTMVSAWAGCEAPSSGELRGCFQYCLEGRAVAEGTFRGVRVERLAGEPEAQGLSLVSETPVSLGVAVDVAVARGHAFVVSVDGPQGPGGLTVLDLGVPAAPVKKAELSEPGDSYWNGVWVKGDALYVASGDSGVRVYDITDPASPTFVRALPGGAANVHTVFVQGEVLYAMDVGRDEVAVYDVSEPLAPLQRSRHVVPTARTTPGAYPHDSFVYEDRLYTFHWSLGMQVSDVTNPARPTFLGAYRYQYATSHTGVVGRYGDRLIAFEGGEDWGAHLRVLDVTDPARIHKVGEWRLRPEVSIHNMAYDAARRRLYLAHYQDGVRVLDVSVPETPREVAHYNVWAPGQQGRGRDFYEGAIGIRLPRTTDTALGNLVFVVDTERGLLVLHEG